MTRPLAALIAAILFLPAAGLQEGPNGDKEKEKQELQKREEEAKAALKAYREKRTKSKSEDDVISAIGLLKDAKPHKLIRTELLSLLNNNLPPKIRIEAAESLGEYKKDPIACDGLLQVAKSARGDDLVDLRKECLRRFGNIAPFGKSVDLRNFFSEPDTVVAREAIGAVESIKSVRMLASLVALLGELERIREDDGKDPGKDPGPEVPGGGQKQGDNNSQRKRKTDLLEPTKKAINTIYGKHDPKKQLKDYTEANRAVADARAELRKIQDQEDAEDKKP